MKAYFGKKHFGSLTGLCVLFAGLCLGGSGTATAQEQPSGVTPPPKVLVIQREFLKPGKSGSLHEKSESAFVQAFTEAKWPEHYMAMDSLSGKSRALFFLGYDSFEAAEKDNDAMRNNATLANALDSAQVADGELLDAYDSSTFVYREDLSLRAPVDIAHMRYMEITVFNVRPGHQKDWNTLSKMYIDAWGKMPDAHWALYEKWYGTDSGTRYIAISPMKSMTEVDQELADEKQFRSGATADQKKQMSDLFASTIESVETNLFMISPKMSYVSDSWKKANPGFWDQK